MNNLNADIPGFMEFNENENPDEKDAFPKNKPSKKGGGFQSMGLSLKVLKGIIKRGYKIPTPIQRKTIPVVLSGRDVVAMARTGSGKTACFLIPMFEKLKQRVATTGARALFLSPTRELAQQTLKFTKELGQFMDLKTVVVLGGDSMDDQFAALHGNPDIIIATPGRFLHLCVEMDFKLNNIEYVVFDEADRLFEMGLGQQLTEIVTRLPDMRQTLLFSATLPRVLVDFAKAGLCNPVLIRLDVESKLPPELDLFYISVRQKEKLSALLVLLSSFVANNELTIIFVSTKHHVEYLHMILDSIGMANSYIYSSLDPSARKIHAVKFSSGKVKILIVTDVAARGIDIPKLNNVINYDFPGKPKLFLHRVGRCARAGMSGKAYSLVTPDDYAHLLDLHLFLGRTVSICRKTNKEGNFGKLPQSLLEEQSSALFNLHETHSDVENLRIVSENGYLQYMRSRPVASADSNKKAKELSFQTCLVHPLFRKSDEFFEEEKETVLDKMRAYRPHGTVFEILGKTKSREYLAMKEKRALNKQKIIEHHTNEEERLLGTTFFEESSTLAKSKESDINETFTEIIRPKKRKLENLYKLKLKKDDNFIPYAPVDRHTEEGLAVDNFQREAKNAEFDIIGDSQETIYNAKKMKKWDRKKKKMVGVESHKAGKIKTESGAWISATYKSDRYNRWKEKTKAGEINDELQPEEDGDQSFKGLLKTGLNTRWSRHNEKIAEKNRKSVIKSAEEILKARKIAARNKYRNMKKRKNRGKSRGKKH